MRQQQPWQPLSPGTASRAAGVALPTSPSMTIPNSNLNPFGVRFPAMKTRGSLMFGQEFGMAPVGTTPDPTKVPLPMSIASGPSRRTGGTGIDVSNGVSCTLSSISLALTQTELFPAVVPEDSLTCHVTCTNIERKCRPARTTVLTAICGGIPATVQTHAEVEPLRVPARA